MLTGLEPKTNIPVPVNIQRAAVEGRLLQVPPKREAQVKEQLYCLHAGASILVCKYKNNNKDNNKETTYTSN
jgi:hypothetical protein